MAGGPRSRVAAGSLFPRRIHRAGRDRGDRLPEQGRRLRSAVQSGGRDADDHRRRSQTSRRSHRPHRRAAHLGLGADPSSPCPHHRSRRRPVAGRIALDRLQAWLLPVGARAFAPVPPAVPRRSRRAPKGRPPGLLRRSRAPLPTTTLSPLRSRLCVAPNGSFTPSGPSPGRRRCSPICRATPIGSPSRTPGSSRSTTTASPSNGRTIGSSKATGSRP